MSIPISPQRRCPRRSWSAMMMTMLGEIDNDDAWRDRWEIGDDGSAMTDQDQQFIRERESVRGNWWERREKNKLKREEREKRIKEILISYTNSVRIVANMQQHCSCVAKIMAFGTSDKMRFLVFDVVNVPNIWHLTHLPHLVWMLLHMFYMS